MKNRLRFAGCAFAFLLSDSLNGGNETAIASRTATVDGVNCTIRRASRGPTVILLHGYTQTSRMPAWKTKPSYYLVVSDDKMIPPPAQRKMAERVKAQGTEVAGSHAVYVSKPREVAEIIEKAAASSN